MQQENIPCSRCATCGSAPLLPETALGLAPHPTQEPALTGPSCGWVIRAGCVCNMWVCPFAAGDGTGARPPPHSRTRSHGTLVWVGHTSMVQRANACATCGSAPLLPETALGLAPHPTQEPALTGPSCGWVIRAGCVCNMWVCPFAAGDGTEARPPPHSRTRPHGTLVWVGHTSRVRVQHVGLPLCCRRRHWGSPPTPLKNPLSRDPRVGGSYEHGAKGRASPHPNGLTWKAPSSFGPGLLAHFSHRPCSLNKHWGEETVSTKRGAAPPSSIGTMPLACPRNSS